MPFWLFLAAAAAAGPPKSPSEAIAIAEAHLGRGTTGRYEMRVATASRTLDAEFLNASDDYRAPDDLTFSISLPAARALTKRFGAKPEAYLLGKHVVVDGAVRAIPIVTSVSGFRSERPRFARYQHILRIDDPNQIISVD